MAILMVISAIQFIGVACLMNHVILFLEASQNEGLTAVWNKEHCC